MRLPLRRARHSRARSTSRPSSPHGGHLDDETSPDDIYIACTGGTTGRPKAVLWRQGDLFVAAIGGSDDTDVAAIRARPKPAPGVWFPTSPLMHVAAQWTVFLAASMGATVVLHDDSRRFDAPTILAAAARERANMMTIIGDAYARPLIEELRTNAYDLSASRCSEPAARPPARSQGRLAEMLPGVTIRDGYGASEIGVMGSGDQAGASSRPSASRSSPRRHPRRGPQPVPRSDETEVGWIVRTGHVPLGYLDDEAATNATFPVVDGERVAVAGTARSTPTTARSCCSARSLVVNTGGEKVFVEEVEDVLKRHDPVVDVLVTGRPSERFGQEVVASCSSPPRTLRLRPSCGPGARRPGPVQGAAAVAFVEEVRRHPSGKADYRWAKEQAAERSTLPAERSSPGTLPGGRTEWPDGRHPLRRHLLVRGGELVDGTGAPARRALSARRGSAQAETGVNGSSR